MVHLDRITTRGGDGGRSRLADGTELPKTHPIFAAIGDVDETNCTIGLVLQQPLGDGLARRLRQIQNDLFDLGSDLAIPPGGAWESRAVRITTAAIERLETWIAEASAGLAPLDSFVLPGGSPAGAHLHLARAVARRAERQVLLAWPEMPGADRRSDRAPLLYLNRLSDLLFQWSRLCNDSGRGDVKWVPKGSPG